MRHLSIYEQNLYECVKIYRSWLGRPFGNNQAVRAYERDAAGEGRGGRCLWPASDAEEGGECSQGHWTCVREDTKGRPRTSRIRCRELMN